jgi:hypothetical protein
VRRVDGLGAGLYLKRYRNGLVCEEKRIGYAETSVLRDHLDLFLLQSEGGSMWAAGFIFEPFCVLSGVVGRKTEWATVPWGFGSTSIQSLFYQTHPNLVWPPHTASTLDYSKLQESPTVNPTPPAANNGKNDARSLYNDSP